MVIEIFIPRGLFLRVVVKQNGGFHGYAHL